MHIQGGIITVNRLLAVFLESCPCQMMMAVGSNYSPVNVTSITCKDSETVLVADERSSESVQRSLNDQQRSIMLLPRWIAPDRF